MKVGIVKTWWGRLLNEAVRYSAFVALVVVCISAFQYWKETESRRRAIVFSAWNVVSGSEGRRADGGRSDALKVLRQNHQSMKGMVLDGAVLTGLDLRGSDLSFASLRNVAFEDCRFDGARFINATLADATFGAGCSLATAQFDKTNLKGANFYADDLSETKFREVMADQSTTFADSKLVGAEFAGGSKFVGSDFDRADLTKAVFIRVTMPAARFVKAGMNNCRLSDVDATDAQFQGAVMKHCEFEENSVLRGADFGGAVMEDATFDSVNLENASFFHANLSGATFRGPACSLRNADFTSADLTYVRFVGCDISGAQFGVAKLPDVEAFQHCKGKPASVPWRKSDKR